MAGRARHNAKQPTATQATTTRQATARRSNEAGNDIADVSFEVLSFAHGIVENAGKHLTFYDKNKLKHIFYFFKINKDGYLLTPVVELRLQITKMSSRHGYKDGCRRPSLLNCC